MAEYKLAKSSTTDLVSAFDLTLASSSSSVVTPSWVDTPSRVKSSVDPVDPQSLKRGVSLMMDEIDIVGGCHRG